MHKRYGLYLKSKFTGSMLFRISPEKYERKYCFVFRASTLRFELEVVKC